MKLSREAIQRMVSDRVGGGGGAGGGGGISMDDIQGMGFATQQWVGDNYLSIAFFSSIFKAYTSQMVEVVPNGGDVSTIENIKAMFGFWTEQYVSSLGYNSSGGGGGGADLNLLLDNINDSNIGNIAPTASEVGKCLVYNGNNTWAWATPGGGGGLTYGLAWSYGSVASAQGGSYDGSASRSFVIPKDTSHLSNGAGFITAAALSGYINIGSDGVVEGGQYYDFHLQGSTADYATRLQASGTYSNTLTFPSEDGVIATRNWVSQQGFLTSETYTGTVTSVGLSMPQGFSVSGSPITSSGTLAVSFANGYSLPTTAKQSNWDTAFGWGNHASAGYLLRTEGMRFTDYGNYIAARFVLANGSYDNARAAIAQGDGYIEWWSSGGYFNHEMGFVRAKGNVEVGTSTTDTAHYLQIGGGRLYWDSTNHALYVQEVDSQGNVTAANFYATGGVSSLGMGVSGTASLNTLTLGTLTATTATAATLNVSTIKSRTVGYGPEIPTPEDPNNPNDNYYVAFNYEQRGEDNHYLTDFYNIGLIGEDADKNETWSIEPNGSAVFASASVATLNATELKVGGSGASAVKKIYWDGTYLQVEIGTTTYKFRPDATA